eukprot:g2656.t1
MLAAAQAALTGTDERASLHALAAVMIAFGAASFAALMFLKAPYGRYSKDASPLYGFKMNGTLAWVLQEAPAVLVPLAHWWRAAREEVPLASRVLLGFFLFHYVNRTFVFPFRLRNGKPTPFVVFLLALLFCLVNGHLQSRYLIGFAAYDDAWLRDPRFVVGTALFWAGLAVNWHSDHVLINLRKPGETGYKIPRGGMFELVSGANFFGEIVEWTGFAIACWSLPALAFALFTFCNIGPRAAQHHQWYLSKFDDYPEHRRAVIPFLCALAQIFSVIGVGYVVLSTGFLSESSKAGIGQLVGRLALPAALFRAIATAKLDGLVFSVLAAQVVSKLVLLVITVGVGLALDRSAGRWKTAGIFGLFVVNSNDLALGVPMMTALYPELVVYIFVFALLNNVIQLPLTFAMLEVGVAQERQQQQAKAQGGDEGEGGKGGQGGIALKVVRNLATNPVIAMAFLGLVYNFAFGNSLPYTVDQALRILANAFGCGALVLTGMSSVGKLGAATGKGAAIPIFLTVAKSVLLPIIVRYVGLAFGVQGEPGGADLQSMLFLYGAIPTAAGTVVFALAYDALPAQISSSSVINLVLAAPLMFLSTVLATVHDQRALFNSTHDLAEWLCYLSIAGTAWVLAGFALHGSWRGRYPMPFVFDLSVAQLGYAASFLACEQTHSSPASYFFVMLFENLCRAAIVSLGVCLLCLVRARATTGRRASRALFGSAHAGGWVSGRGDARAALRALHLRCRVVALAFALAIGVAFTAGSLREELDPAFECFLKFGADQWYTMLAVNLAVLAAAGFCFYTYQQQPSSKAAREGEGGLDEHSDGGDSAHADPVRNPVGPIGDSLVSNPGLDAEAQPADFAAQRWGAAGAPATPAAASGVDGSGGEGAQGEGAQGEGTDSGAGSGLKYRVALIMCQELFRAVLQVFLLISYIRLHAGAADGEGEVAMIFSGPALVQIIFVFTFFFAGQGLLTFFTFGLEGSLMAQLRARVWRMRTRFRKVVYGVNVDLVTRQGGSGAANVYATEQSRSLLATASEMAADPRLARTRRHRLKRYPDCMTGQDAVTWLVREHKAVSREEATQIGANMLFHNLLHHVTHEHSFQDDTYFYAFNRENLALVD